MTKEYSQSNHKRECPLVASEIVVRLPEEKKLFDPPPECKVQRLYIGRILG